jgi:hypothetical protein
MDRGDRRARRDAPTIPCCHVDRYALRPPYTSTMATKRRRERDIVRELQEDTEWSSWTNSIDIATERLDLIKHAQVWGWNRE